MFRLIGMLSEDNPQLDKKCLSFAETNWRRSPLISLSERKMNSYLSMSQFESEFEI